ncbi:MAG: flagellar hook protein FlgE [Ignavibacteria bacterium]|jgi:flagellar hook protein FlgE|nr:flagellar hook protein FlgE [Ignavibacteria bacterium]
MSLSRSLSIGTSSLQAHQSKFDVISNNLANASTVGYKANRANFAEQFNQIYNRGKAPEANTGYSNGGTNPLQFGLGVKLASISQDMMQGVIESTNRPLDAALQGDGFFVVNYNGQPQYTRAGAFTRDEEGYLVDTNTGAFIQGYNTENDADGKPVRNSDGSNRLDRTLTNVRIPWDTVSLPRQTQNITIVGNLNSEAPEGSDSIRKTSMTIYDNTGAARVLTFTFEKTAEKGEWNLSAQIDGKDTVISETLIQFKTDGTLESPLAIMINAADANTTLESDGLFVHPIKIQLTDPNNLTYGLKNYSADSTANFEKQDGFPLGDLINLNFDEQGRLLGSFTNGQTEILSQIAIAKFPNNEGLVRNGNNYFSVSPNSGDAIIGTAIEIFPTTQVKGYALEQSNVNLANEFTEMISTQRAYESASRVITVSDTMLAELNQLKR